ncbi:MAG: acyl-CoA dehydratase activase [Bacillota bacterium]
MSKVVAGIDAGSVATKAVVVALPDACTPKVLGLAVVPTGADPVAAAQTALEQALSQAGLQRSDVWRLGGTGYGRVRLPGVDRVVTEITCHALAAKWLHPSVQTVIDVGGQDIKVISVDQGGQVQDFVMNDKCAAGTGRFLQVMATALGMGLDQLAQVSFQGPAAPISSTCTVFAESEVISLIAAGTPLLNIVRGLFQAVAERVQGLATRVSVRPDVVMTGGVSSIKGVPQAISARLGLKVHVPELAQFAGAYGAALVAAGAQVRTV